MINEQQQEHAALYVLGLLSPEDQALLAEQARANAELRELLWSLQRAVGKVVESLPAPNLPPTLKAKVLQRIQEEARTPRRQPTSLAEGVEAGLRFLPHAAESGWKALPIPGAYIKLLSLQRERGYAVLLGKLDPGVHYPAHTNAGPEDFYILSGDLQVSGRALRAGDYHHADAGSAHEENYSIEGCTLLAVLTVDDPLVSFAMA